MFDLMLTALLIAQGPCPNGQCPSPVPGAVVPLRYEWRAIPKTTSQVALFGGSLQVGAFSFDTKVYRPFRDGKWGQPTLCPVPPPKPPAKTIVEVEAPSETNDTEPLNFGLNLQAIRDQYCPTGYAKNGKCITVNETVEALNVNAPAKDFPDDSAKDRVISIGTKGYNDKVKHALGDAGLLSVVNFQAFAPNSPMIQCGFQTQGDSVYIQNKNDVIVHHEKSVEGAEGIVTAVRKTRPDYDPKKDPNLNAPVTIDPVSYLKSVYAMFTPTEWLVGCLAAVGVFFAFKSKSNQKKVN